MRSKLMAGLVMAAALGPAAMAQDNTDATQQTVTTAPEISEGVFGKTWTVTPQVGVLGYGDGNGNYTSRILEGLTTNVDLANLAQVPGFFTMALQSGILYSHIGSPGANFVGTNAGIETTPGANSFLVPINLAFGLKPLDQWLVALDLGTSLIYRSIGTSMVLGRASDSNTSGSTEFFPEAGLNLGYAASKSVGISVRGDYIPTPAQDMFNITLGAVLGLV